MNIARTIDLLQTLHTSALEQAKQTHISSHGIFYTINQNDEVNTHRLIAQTIFPGVKYIIGCIAIGYNDFGWVTNHWPFVILDGLGQIIQSIKGNIWTLKRIHFLASTNLPSPEITFALNSAPENTFTHTFFSRSDFQVFWNYFLKIDQYCSNVNEAKFYLDYYLTSLENNDLRHSIEEYKDEVQKKASLLNQHEQLLNQIKYMVEGTVRT